MDAASTRSIGARQNATGSQFFERNYFDKEAKKCCATMVTVTFELEPKNIIPLIAGHAHRRIVAPGVPDVCVCVC